MDHFIELLKSIKFPNLTASGLALYFGYALVVESGDSINTAPEGVGILLLSVGVLLLLITFIDFRHKDSTDSAIASQTKTIKTLESVVKSISATRRQEEKSSQKTMTSGADSGELGGGGKKEFRLEDSNSTPTS